MVSWGRYGSRPVYTIKSIKMLAEISDRSVYLEKLKKKSMLDEQIEFDSQKKQDWEVI